MTTATKQSTYATTVDSRTGLVSLWDVASQQRRSMPAYLVTDAMLATLPEAERQAVLAAVSASERRAAQREG